MAPTNRAMTAPVLRASLLGDEVPGAGNRCVVLVLGAGNMLLEHLLPTLGCGVAVGVGGEKRPFPLLQRGHGVPADRRARVVAGQRNQRGHLAQPGLVRAVRERRVVGGRTSAPSGPATASRKQARVDVR